jgi:hypothetical protein
MKTKLIAASIMLLVTSAALAQKQNYPKAKVSFDDFKGLVAEVEVHRATRLVDLDTFLQLSGKPGVIILDTRSKFRFDRIHLKGAKHLNFSDFTQDNLRRTIPAFETTVLIYCNNNFEGNQTDFASKIALPVASPRVTPATQFKAQAKPRMMALNIPTYVNLYGYGYRNIYELAPLIDVEESKLAFKRRAP